MRRDAIGIAISPMSSPYQSDQRKHFCAPSHPAMNLPVPILAQGGDLYKVAVCSVWESGGVSYTGALPLCKAPCAPFGSPVAYLPCLIEGTHYHMTHGPKCARRV